MTRALTRSTNIAPTDSNRICSIMKVGLMTSPMLARKSPVKTFLTYKEKKFMSGASQVVLEDI